MGDKEKSLVRKVALVALIIFDIIMLVFWWLAENYTFFWTFVGITLVVIIGEIVNALWVYKATLSTQAKHTIQKGGKSRIYVYGALVSLGLAIASLIVHLGVV